MSIILTATKNNYISDLYLFLSRIIPAIKVWYPTQQSLYSLLDNGEKFEYLFCENEHLTSATIEAINEYNIQTVTFGHLGDKKVSPKVKCLLRSDIGPLFPEDFSDYLYLAPAANAPDIYNDKINKKDIYYITEKSIIDGTIQHLLDNNISVKIVGPHHLPYKEYLGQIDTKTRMKILTEAKIVILDNIDYIYDVGISKSYALIAIENTLYPNFDNKEELLDQINEFNNAAYVEHVLPAHKKRAFEFAVQNTFIHRIIEIFTRLDRKDIVEICLKLL